MNLQLFRLKLILFLTHFLKALKVINKNRLQETCLS